MNLFKDEFYYKNSFSNNDTFKFSISIFSVFFKDQITLIDGIILKDKNNFKDEI